MAGRRSLRKIQLGRESTSSYGVEVDATTIWRGLGTLLDNRKVAIVSEDVGIIGGTTRTNTAMKGGTINMTQTPATFEQFLHVLEASIKTTTGSTDGGTGYIYTYALPTTSGTTIKTYTIEGGDDAGEEQMLYSFVKDWTLSGDGRNGYQLNANWQGRDVAPGTFTGALTLPSVSNMNFGMTKFYIDDATGTVGTTQKSNTVRKISVKFESGIEAKDTADGRLDFSFHQQTSYKFTGQIEFEHDATSIAQKAAWRAETAQLMQIKIEGSAADTFSSTGTNYAVPTVKINLPFKWSNFEKIGEANGNDIVQGSFFSAYDTSAAAAGTVIVVAELASIP